MGTQKTYKIIWKLDQFDNLWTRAQICNIQRTKDTPCSACAPHSFIRHAMDQLLGVVNACTCTLAANGTIKSGRNFDF